MGCIDISVGGIGVPLDEGSCGQDLTALAIAALGNVHLVPSLLHRVLAIFAEPFDGGDFHPGDASRGSDAGSHRHTVYQNGAGAALTDSTGILGPGHV